MSGRDTADPHRSATPLELLFDLAFVVSFGIAGDQFAHAVADGHWQSGLLSMGFAVASISWAWMSFSWFASAYDTDDWVYRLTTLIHMVGVVVLALGLPAWFASFDSGDSTGNSVSLSGYVLMRLAMIAQWLRVVKQDPERRRTALTYVLFVGAAQVGWIVLTLTSQSSAQFVALAVGLLVVETAGPVLAERKTAGTPWHARHVAERHGLLTIIALGEVIFGTVAAVSVLIERQGLSAEAILVVIAGVGLAFGLWWIYFLLPSGAVLERHRDRMRAWGYLHFLVYGSITSTGAGLHVAAYVIEGDSEIGILGAVLAIVLPVLVFAAVVSWLYAGMLRTVSALHLWLLSATVAVLGVAVILAVTGAPIGACLLVITAAPAVSIVGFETIGHRHHERALGRVLD
ncbi:low temperature requirement protein A [Rathayibacter sp. VKM Ac-2762]|uniref:low temperature requirement protein A n=1 Tax=Rathayibacter sp. VKM Ac-2762 TaxID=2609254 RepID=UPI00132E926C|nr:low temperature requirement protein A [Rathayibacter sp. VKM Ac-2762]QHF21153.1 low temperature requirement protein A [Rathayibacter sp. VKM Ac-2762]